MRTSITPLAERYVLTWCPTAGDSSTSEPDRTWVAKPSVDTLPPPAHNRWVAAGPGRRTLTELLADACARIERFTPQAAHAATARGGLIVDIRSETDRRRDGIVPGSLHIPRTVLEWRADPDGPFRNPHLGGLGECVILLCDHGCSSILAAATLAELGYRRAGDVIGGFAAWRGAGLPIRSAPPRARGSAEPAGMHGPDG
jgi:rhodanese-related sulfurtransferase